MNRAGAELKGIDLRDRRLTSERWRCWTGCPPDRRRESRRRVPAGRRQWRPTPSSATMTSLGRAFWLLIGRARGPGLYTTETSFSSRSLVHGGMSPNEGRNSPGNEPEQACLSSSFLPVPKGIALDHGAHDHKRFAYAMYFTQYGSSTGCEQDQG